MSLNSDGLTSFSSEEIERKRRINVGNLERLVSALAGGGLAAYGFRQRSLGGLCLALAGTTLLHRGATGYCRAYEALDFSTSESIDANGEPVARDVHIEKAIVVDKTPEELFTFWRQFENLPRFMKHLESVTCGGLNRSHWIAKGPAGTKVEWDAEIYNEKPNELIAWRSLEGSDIVNAGSVRFTSLGVRGTEVRVVMNYNAPGGKISALVAKLFGSEPGQMIAEDLRRLKQILETGEAATTEGQPSGRDAEARPFDASTSSASEPKLKTRTASAS